MIWTNTDESDPTLSGGFALNSDDWRWHEIMVDALCSAYDSAMIGYKSVAPHCQMGSN